jgi:hypothetical protein
MQDPTAAPRNMLQPDTSLPKRARKVRYNIDSKATKRATILRDTLTPPTRRIGQRKKQ